MKFSLKSRRSVARVAAADIRCVWGLAVLTLAILCSGSVLQSECHAVVVASGDGTGNTTPPADDPGFLQVGTRGIGNVVYLGNRWVLTAAHVGAGPTDFGGAIYEHDPDQVHRLTNPTGNGRLSSDTDLLLFQLLEDPGLLGFRLGCESPDLGSQVSMMGSGRRREPDLTYWNVTVRNRDDDDVWEEVGPPPPAVDFTGFETTGVRELRWGENVVTRTDFDIESGWGDVLSFQTTFDQESEISDEAQAVVGDSGGPVLQKTGSTWELVGLIHAVELQENQPGEARTAIFGNETYIADISQYADQIRLLADFEPIPGDFDQDGDLLAPDIDALMLEIRSGGHGCHFDLNGDGDVDESDVDSWLESVGSLSGDADLSGHVGFEDFVVLADNFNSEGGWAQGNFNADTMVEFSDFVALANNFGKSGTESASQASGVAVAVPEPRPRTLAIVGLLVIALANCRRSIVPLE